MISVVHDEALPVRNGAPDPSYRAWRGVMPADRALAAIRAWFRVRAAAGRELAFTVEDVFAQGPRIAIRAREGRAQVGDINAVLVALLGDELAPASGALAASSLDELLIAIDDAIARERPKLRGDLAAETLGGGLAVVATPDGEVVHLYDVELALACGMDGVRGVPQLVSWAFTELGLTTNAAEVRGVIALLATGGCLEIDRSGPVFTSISVPPDDGEMEFVDDQPTRAGDPASVELVEQLRRGVRAPTPVPEPSPDSSVPSIDLSLDEPLPDDAFGESTPVVSRESLLEGPSLRAFDAEDDATPVVARDDLPPVRGAMEAAANAAPDEDLDKEFADESPTSATPFDQLPAEIRAVVKAPTSRRTPRGYDTGPALAAAKAAMSRISPLPAGLKPAASSPVPSETPSAAPTIVTPPPKPITTLPGVKSSPVPSAAASAAPTAVTAPPTTLPGSPVPSAAASAAPTFVTPTPMTMTPPVPTQPTTLRGAPSSPPPAIKPIPAPIPAPVPPPVVASPPDLTPEPEPLPDRPHRAQSEGVALVYSKPPELGTETLRGMPKPLSAIGTIRPNVVEMDTDPVDPPSRATPVSLSPPPPRPVVLGVCPSCKTENKVSGKFCRTCGTPLSTAAPSFASDRDAPTITISAEMPTGQRPRPKPTTNTRTLIPESVDSPTIIPENLNTNDDITAAEDDYDSASPTIPPHLAGGLAGLDTDRDSPSDFDDDNRPTIRPDQFDAETLAKLVRARRASRRADSEPAEPPTSQAAPPRSPPPPPSDGFDMPTHRAKPSAKQAAAAPVRSGRMPLAAPPDLGEASSTIPTGMRAAFEETDLAPLEPMRSTNMLPEPAPVQPMALEAVRWDDDSRPAVPPVPSRLSSHGAAAAPPPPTPRPQPAPVFASCAACGSPLAPDARFCGVCGTPVVAAAPPPPPQPLTPASFLPQAAFREEPSVEAPAMKNIMAVTAQPWRQNGSEPSGQAYPYDPGHARQPSQPQPMPAPDIAPPPPEAIAPVGATHPPAPRKSRTALWVLLALVVLAAAGAGVTYALELWSLG